MSGTTRRILVALLALLLPPLTTLHAADPTSTTCHTPLTAYKCLYNVESLMHCNEGISAAIAVLYAVDAPLLVEPADGTVLSTGIPHFCWQPNLAADITAMPDYQIQIAADEAFAQVVDEDRIAAVIAWYRPDRELKPADYWWRVAGMDASGARGPWSAVRKFSIRQPTHVVKIPRSASFAEIRQALAAAVAATPALVQFEPGNYRLDPDDTRAFVSISNASDVVIDGGGAKIVFTHPLSLVQTINCRRVLVKNFQFDFDPPAYTAGRVVTVEPRAGWMEAEILPGHARPDEWPAYQREKKGMLVSEREHFAIKRDIQLVVSHAGFERVAERRFRFRFDRPQTARLFGIGDIYVLDPRWYAAGGNHGALANGGEDVVFYQLTLRSAANECFGSFYSNRHSLLHVKLERGPGRALSVNNGGNNHHNARTGPWIEGCTFENCGDDVCHINGYAMGIAAQPASDRLLINRHQPYDQFGNAATLDFRSGDRLLFFCRRDGKLLGEARVASAAVQEKAVEVSLDRAVTGLTIGPLTSVKGVDYAAAGNTAVTECYNASRMCNQFVFRNNVARNSRRIGVLAKGEGGLIENNLFENLGGGGVEFWNAPFEGLTADHYVVRNNRILNCGRLAREHAAIWATVFKSGSDRLHRNLLIANNQIVGFPSPAILLRDVEDVVLRDNRIVAVSSEREPITLLNTAAVRMEGNSVSE